MSASFFWMSWLEARGLPNCFLSITYCLAVSRQNSAAPSAPQLIPYLALFKHPKGPYGHVHVHTYDRMKIKQSTSKESVKYSNGPWIYGN